jgi:hypothetical protein
MDGIEGLVRPCLFDRSCRQMNRRMDGWMDGWEILTKARSYSLDYRDNAPCGGGRA